MRARRNRTAAAAPELPAARKLSPPGGERLYSACLPLEVSAPATLRGWPLFPLPHSILRWWCFFQLHRLASSVFAMQHHADGPCPAPAGVWAEAPPLCAMRAPCYSAQLCLFSQATIPPCNFLLPCLPNALLTLCRACLCQALLSLGAFGLFFPTAIMLVYLCPRFWCCPAIPKGEFCQTKMLLVLFSPRLPCHTLRIP